MQYWIFPSWFYRFFLVKMSKEYIILTNISTQKISINFVFYYKVIGVDPHGSILAEPEELNNCDNPIYHVSNTFILKITNIIYLLHWWNIWPINDKWTPCICRRNQPWIILQTAIALWISKSLPPLGPGKVSAYELTELTATTGL